MNTQPAYRIATKPGLFKQVKDVLSSITKSNKPNDPFKPFPNGLSPYGEAGGPTGPEPTRYGDWERRGRCSDF